MADMYGAIRSNVFKVKDTEAFLSWFEKYQFGQAIEIWTDNEGISFGGYEQYPSAFPVLVPDDDDEIEAEADIDEFADGLRSHLAEGEVFSVFAAGNEKLRYVAGSILVIRETGPVLFCCMNSDDTDSLIAAADREST